MTSVALENIWDAPVVKSPSKSKQIYQDDNDTSGRPSKPLQSSLFLDSDSEHESAKQTAPKPVPSASSRPDIDALFEALDEEPDNIFQELPPSLDLDAIRHQEDAKNARALAKSSPLDLNGASSQKRDGGPGSRAGKGDEIKEKRKPLPKLDEARLLGPDGFPALVQQAKTFKPRGKGHESSDLNRLLQVYQFWTHKMYPKTQFRDTVQRVEKLCHSKRMHVALSVWRDESKGLVNGQKMGLGSDRSDDSDDDHGSDGKRHPASEPEDRPNDRIASSSRPPSQPPSSASEPSSDAYDDFDIDALIQEEERREAAAATSGSLPPPVARSQYFSKETTATVSAAIDGDEAMWDELMGDISDVALPMPPDTRQDVNPATAGGALEEDEDMWDVVREMEAVPAPRPDVRTDTGQPLNTASAAAKPTNEEGWDEMYL